MFFKSYGENENVVNRFINDNKGFELKEMRTIFPQEFDCDGFFYAVIGRMEEEEEDIKSLNLQELTTQLINLGLPKFVQSRSILGFISKMQRALMK